MLQSWTIDSFFYLSLFLMAVTIVNYFICEFKGKFGESHEV